MNLRNNYDHFECYIYLILLIIKHYLILKTYNYRGAKGHIYIIYRSYPNKGGHKGSGAREIHLGTYPSTFSPDKPTQIVETFPISRWKVQSKYKYCPSTMHLCRNRR